MGSLIQYLSKLLLLFFFLPFSWHTLSHISIWFLLRFSVSIPCNWPLYSRFVDFQHWSFTDSWEKGTDRHKQRWRQRETWHKMETEIWAERGRYTDSDLRNSLSCTLSQGGGQKEMKVSEIFGGNNIGSDDREGHTWGNNQNRSWGPFGVCVPSLRNLANWRLCHDTVTDLTNYSDDNTLQVCSECLVRLRDSCLSLSDKYTSTSSLLQRTAPLQARSGLTLGSHSEQTCWGETGRVVFRWRELDIWC